MHDSSAKSGAAAGRPVASPPEPDATASAETASPSPAPSPPARKRGPKGPDKFIRKGRCLVEVGEMHRDKALYWVGRFGWMNWYWLACAMWPDSPPKSAQNLASGMLERLYDDGLLQKTVCGGHYEVFVLSSTGALELQMMHPLAFGTAAAALAMGEDGSLIPGREFAKGIRSGLRLTSVRGATYLHRFVGNTYLASCLAQGRTIATEYDQLTGSGHWTLPWTSVLYHGKRPDGLDYVAHDIAGLDMKIVEVLLNAPRTTPRRKLGGAVIEQDEMGDFLRSLHYHTTNGQGVVLVMIDDAPGRNIANEIVREATKRDIPVVSDLIQLVFVKLEAGECRPIGLSKEPWPKSKNDAKETAPTTRARAPQRSHEFRLLSDERDETGEREIVIQHLRSGWTVRANTDGTDQHRSLYFDAFDTRGERQCIGDMWRDASIDLNDPAEWELLVTEMRVLVAGAGI